jgi:GYF domain 2
MEYYVYHEGRQVGPLTLGEVTDRLANGQLSQSDHVWHEGLNRSKPLSELFQPPSQAGPPIQVERETPPYQTAPPMQQFQGVSGIPDDVMQKIRAAAAREYPDDYVMQKYTVEQQCEAFSELRKLRVPNIPPNVFAKMSASAAEEYPDDYVMQKYTIEQQLEAYRDLNSA